MALRPINSVGGFSVGESPKTVIDANGTLVGASATAEPIAVDTASTISQEQL